jgi:lipopolysaccharide/colanic/teichoic acid biosynthesis glycosyltransferase
VNNQVPRSQGADVPTGTGVAIRASDRSEPAASAALLGKSEALTSVPLSPPARSRTKRAFDILLSLLMLLVSSPVWLVLSLLILIEDGRPIFFAQERWGLGAKPFRILKFRSMRHEVGEGPAVVARARDPRATRVGRIFRRTGLDELPNLLGILRGQMSFVGPRALAVEEMIQEVDGRYHTYVEVPGFAQRLSVRPGLTGLATVYVARDASPRRKFACDLLYIRRWSFGLDLRLVGMSFLISFLGRWERRGRKL